MLASRYVTFYRSLVTCKKFGVRFLARIQERDNRTVLARTLESLLTEYYLPPSMLNELIAPLVNKKCS